MNCHAFDTPTHCAAVLAGMGSKSGLKIEGGREHELTSVCCMRPSSKTFSQGKGNYPHQKKTVECTLCLKDSLCLWCLLFVTFALFSGGGSGSGVACVQGEGESGEE